MAENVQEPLAGMLAPVSAKVMPVGVADAVPPGQLVSGLAGLAITTLPGKLSVTLTPVMADALALVRVTVKTLVAP